MVAEGDVLPFDTVVVKCDRCVAVYLLLRLEDLDAVDVPDYGTAHLIGGLHRTGKVLGVAAHDHHHEKEGDGEHRQ